MAMAQGLKRKADSWVVREVHGNDEEIGGPRPAEGLGDTPLGRYCLRLESRVRCRDAIIAAQEDIREDRAPFPRDQSPLSTICEDGYEGRMKISHE